MMRIFVSVLSMIVTGCIWSDKLSENTLAPRMIEGLCFEDCVVYPDPVTGVSAKFCEIIRNDESAAMYDKSHRPDPIE